MRTAGIIVIALAVGFGVGFLVKAQIGGEPTKQPDATTGATYSAAPPEEGYEVPGLAGPVYEYGENVYRGGEPTSIEGVQALHDWGVKTVVSVTPTELERQLCEKYDLTLVEVPFEKTELSGETIDKVLETLKSGKGPFYLHCHGGRHRGGALGLIYRIGVLGWDVDRAIKEYEDRGGHPHTKDKPVVDAILEHLDIRRAEPADDTEPEEKEKAP